MLHIVITLFSFRWRGSCRGWRWRNLRVLSLLRSTYSANLKGNPEKIITWFEWQIYIISSCTSLSLIYNKQVNKIHLSLCFLNINNCTHNIYVVTISISCEVNVKVLEIKSFILTQYVFISLVCWLTSNTMRACKASHFYLLQ